MMETHADLIELLERARERGASDVHLGEGEEPWFRVDGELERVDAPALDEAGLAAILESITTPRQRESLLRTGDVDLAIEIEGVRYRINVFRERDRSALSIRRLGHEIRGYDELGLPEVIRSFTTFEHGLVVFTGPTGSGKTTSLATLVDTINQESRRHVITIEDPIEYWHRSGRSLVRQREIGRDVEDFSSAIRGSLREDPDVILVGEMRDAETMRAALRAAETGHLVLSTLHTGDASGAIERVLGTFSGAEQASLRQQLSLALRAVVAQRLMKRRNGGRIAACEVLVNTKAVANLIRSGQTQQIPSMIEAGADVGMRTMRKALDALVAQGIIESEADAASGGAFGGPRR